MMGCVSVDVRAVGSSMKAVIRKTGGCASVRCEAAGKMTVVMGDVNHPMTEVVGMPGEKLNVGVGAVRKPVNVNLGLVCTTAGRYLDLNKYQIWVVEGFAEPVDVRSNVRWKVE